jgi:glutamyl-tRNA synthetase
LDKFRWLNNYYIKNSPPEKLFELLTPFFKQKGYIKEDSFDRNWLIDLIKLFQARVSTLQELVDWSGFCFAEDVEFSPEAKEKLLEEKLIKEFEILKQRFSALKNFDHASVEEVFRKTIEELNIKSKVLIHPLRAALTGALIGPGIFEVISLLGKDRVCQRLSRAIEIMKEAG